MNPIRTNKPVFFGDDGEVLKSGHIYIGQPNQWPLSFPKAVTLQDSAGSQFTAAQPLKTGTDGRITYNGKSVIALVDGDYSILVRDRNGVTVGEGYTPFVENTDPSSGNVEAVTSVGLLLSDIKQFDVTPGDTVRNVGKITTLDGLGADWLVISNTGTSGDDNKLIDFSNGTQGKRVSSYVLGGPGQEWADVTAQRASGMIYSNTTGRPICVFVTGYASSAGEKVTLDAYVRGGIIGQSSSFDDGATRTSVTAVQFIVPDGASYQVDASDGVIQRWSELR